MRPIDLQFTSPNGKFVKSGSRPVEVSKSSFVRGPLASNQGNWRLLSNSSPASVHFVRCQYGGLFPFTIRSIQRLDGMSHLFGIDVQFKAASFIICQGWKYRMQVCTYVFIRYWLYVKSLVRIFELKMFLTWIFSVWSPNDTNITPSFIHQLASNFEFPNILIGTDDCNQVHTLMVYTNARK